MAQQPPQSTPPIASTLKPAAVEELRALHTMLHLLFHRNKNQHRRSAWWRFFAGFRRELGRLLRELDELGAGSGGIGAGVTDGAGEARTKGKVSGEARREGESRVEERVRVWRDARVAGWWLAFANLTASTQFSALGLVLLAALARVCRVVGVTAGYEEMAHEEVRRVLDAFAAREGAELFGAVGARGGGVVAGDGEDLGEVVERGGGGGKEDGDGGDGGGGGMAARVVREETAGPAVQEGVAGMQSKEAAKKGKRKKGNAIDDLFSGVV